MVFDYEGSESLRPLLARLTSTIPHPFFVKVGANDGVTDDPCGEYFLKHESWRGLLVEPVPYCIRKLEATYSDRDRFVIVGQAVAESAGVKPFYFVSEDAKRAIPDLPSWYDQLGSFNRGHIVGHLDGVLEPFIVESNLPVDRLDSILDKHNVSAIDVLHVDTEGYDLEVLKSLALRKHLPIVIFIEHKHLSLSDRHELRKLMEASRYRVRDLGNDFLAVHRGISTLIQRRLGIGRWLA